MIVLQYFILCFTYLLWPPDIPSDFTPFFPVFSLN